MTQIPKNVSQFPKIVTRFPKIYDRKVLGILLGDPVSQKEDLVSKKWKDLF